MPEPNDDPQSPDEYPLSPDEPLPQVEFHAGTTN